MKCVQFETRQFFRLAAVVMALVLLWRYQVAGHDKFVLLVGLITLIVDGALLFDGNKECA